MQIHIRIGDLGLTNRIVKHSADGKLSYPLNIVKYTGDGDYYDTIGEFEYETDHYKFKSVSDLDCRTKIFTDLYSIGMFLLNNYRISEDYKENDNG